MAPLGTDAAPRLAEGSDAQPFVQIAKHITATPQAIETPAVQAAILPIGDVDDTSTITTSSIEPASQPEPSLRGPLAEGDADPDDVDAAIAAAYDAEAADEPLGPPEPVRQTVNVTVESGDTLGKILTELGVPGTEAREAVAALSEHFKPRELRIGQSLEIEMESLPIEVATLSPEDLDAPAPSLVSFSIAADSERTLRVLREAEEGTFASQEIFRELNERVVRAKGRIDGSLFATAGKLGVPAAVTVEFMRLYSYSVDFQREIHKGDTFEIYYTEYDDEDGNYVKAGDILFASLTNARKPKQLWRFEIPGEGVVDYFDENGQSMKKFLMKTPIDGARISSNFGKRRHPILGYTKMHTGTDFAAPSGTPIYAAGNGTIEVAGWNGGYGKYVRIRHANGYKTAYAHMSRIAKGITPGARVTQGQTIGAVGTTGRSTGPHLHYEVHVKDKKVNPMTIKVPTGRKLEGKELAAFKSARETIAADMAKIAPLKPIETASATAESGTSVE